MLERFRTHLRTLGISAKDGVLLVALSGGPDSVTLCALLQKSGYSFSVAHCNFGLRAEESEGDEEFCVRLAEQLGATCHVKKFDAGSYAREQGMSIQEAARELRYGYFFRLCEDFGYPHLLTAHHAGDNTETVLLNLLRGTGINGLKGIPEKNGLALRPLLPFTRDELLAFAAEQKLEYRLDSSNRSDKYERNFLRQHVIPKLRELRPSVDALFRENSMRFREEAAIIDHYCEQRKTALLRKTETGFSIAREALRKETHLSVVLHHLLSPLGFSAGQQKNMINNIRSNITEERRYDAAGHSAFLEREALVIRDLTEPEQTEITITGEHSLSEYFQVEESSELNCTGPDALCIEAETLSYPLILRNPRKGDKIQPFGMNGTKLLSDLFREQKFSRSQKARSLVLVNGNGDILWVPGLRSSERYRVRGGGRRVLKIQMNERS